MSSPREQPACGEILSFLLIDLTNHRLQRRLASGSLATVLPLAPGVAPSTWRRGIFKSVRELLIRLRAERRLGEMLAVSGVQPSMSHMRPRYVSFLSFARPNSWLPTQAASGSWQLDREQPRHQPPSLEVRCRGFLLSQAGPRNMPIAVRQSAMNAAAMTFYARQAELARQSGSPRERSAGAVEAGRLSDLSFGHLVAGRYLPGCARSNLATVRGCAPVPALGSPFAQAPRARDRHRRAAASERGDKIKATQAMYWIIGRDNPRQPPALAAETYDANGAPIALRELATFKDPFVDGCEVAATQGVPADRVTHDEESTDFFAQAAA